MKKGLGIPVCPEVLGGLTVPRTPAEIVPPSKAHERRSVWRGAAVVTADGVDVTRQYMEGAWKALFIGFQAGCSKAVLKARSPSCGPGQIYDGTFSGQLVQGHGVFAELLKAHGIEVYTEENLAQLELGR